MTHDHDQTLITQPQWIVAPRAETEEPAEPSLALAVVETDPPAIAETKHALAPVAVGLVTLLERREAIMAEIQELEEAGLCEATLVPEWRRSRNGVEPYGPYYRLVYPTDERGWRRREYIGNKPERVAKAKAAIARHRRHCELAQELHWLELSLSRIKTHLEQVQDLLNKRDW